VGSAEEVRRRRENKAFSDSDHTIGGRDRVSEGRERGERGEMVYRIRKEFERGS